MKHWKALNDLESSIGDLHVPKDILSLLTLNAENISTETNISILYHVEKLLQTTVEELQDKFQTLFIEVRNDG